MSARLSKKHQGQKGILGGSAETITNMTAILTVIGITMGLAYGVYKWSFSTSEWEALDGLVSASRRTYQGETYPSTSGAMASQLISSQATGNLRISSGNILNTYGSAYTITGAGGNFSITDSTVPASDCINMLKQVPATGYLSVAVNSGTAITTFPITAANATTACNVTTSAGNSIVVTAQ
jgi:hypothetical protein